jgi:hypothetical protein
MSSIIKPISPFPPLTRKKPQTVPRHQKFLDGYKDVLLSGPSLYESKDIATMVIDYMKSIPELERNEFRTRPARIHTEVYEVFKKSLRGKHFES